MASSKKPSATRSRTSRTRSSPRTRRRLRIAHPDGPVSRRVATAELSALRPRERLSAHEWAERERWIPTGPEPGRWRSRAYQRPVLEAISNPNIQGVVYPAASQGGGKTEMLLNASGYFMDADPSDILLVEPSLDVAEAYSKDRLAKMIEASPALKGKVRDPRSRDSGNTVRHKVFPGGSITMVGANSASGLSSRPIRVVLFDEVDRYPASAGSEGDPVRLAQTRTRAYAIHGTAKEIYCSSPGDKASSALLKAWRKTDQREWYIPCPECGTEQFTKWAQVHWDKDDLGESLPETAVYVCEKCGCPWDDVTRWAAIDRGTDRPNPDAKTSGLPGWYGLRLPGMSVYGQALQPLVEQFLEAKGSRELMKVFVNTVLCEWFEEKGDSLDEDVLLERREDWSLLLPKGAEVPDGPAVLTLGADPNGDWVEWAVIGWGRGEESWLVDHGKLYGNIKEDDSVLLELDEVLAQPWLHAKGVDLYIRAAAVDTGYATQKVYGYCKPRLRRPLPNGQSQFVFAVKGRAEPGRPVWPETSSLKKTLAGRINMWTVGVNAAKDQCMARFGIAEPGPGYAHVSKTASPEFLRGLLSEEAHVEYRAGRGVRVWRKKSAGLRNDPWDCWVYSYAALEGLKARPFLIDLHKECAKLERVEPSPSRSSTAPQSPKRRRRTVGYEL